MTMVRRLFFILTLVVASLASGSAQTMPTMIARHYTTDEGLPSNNVLCVLKDRDGFLWFGTWYGLCRFDGDRFVTYNKPLRTGDIPPRKIESLLEDAQGRLWLKTVDWKLYVFDRLTERFHAVYDELKAHTKNLQVIKIQRTDEGRILLLTKDKTLLTAESGDGSLIRITKLFDSHGQIEPQTLQLRHDVRTTAHGYAAYIGRDYRILTVKGTLKSLDAALEKDAEKEQQQTARLQQKAETAGIAKYSQLYQDYDSLVWVTTTAQGVYCISTPRQLFSLIPLPEQDQTGVRCIYQLRNGSILVSTRSRNVYIYGADGQLQRTLPYSQYAIGAVYHALEDSIGRLWLSTKGDGLVLATPDVDQPLGYRIEHYRHLSEDRQSISGNNVYMTFIDSQQHVWVCTLDGGLNLVSEQAGQLTFYNHRNGFSQYPAYGLYTEVRNIVEDTKGRLLVGTIDGLMSFDNHFKRPEDIHFETYHDSPEASFANNDIYTLFRDHKGQIWVGAFGGGLQRLEGGPLGPREGLRNDVIYSMTEDLQHHLWFATEAGLSLYNQDTGRIRNFDRYDGLPDVQMEETAATCCRDGRLWIGSKQGILTFSPKQLQTSKSSYRTFILEVVADNQPYHGTTATPYAKDIVLNHDQNAFTIEFAALNYQNHGSVSYRYRLEGFDRDWRYSGTHRVASYNEVPSGNYTFVVETLDDANPTLRSSARLDIRILPPWWATWWAYLIYIGIAALIAWLVIRTILQMNRMRNEIYISQRLAKLTTKPDDGDEFIDRLHRIIRENIANSEFNIDAIASEMGLSRSAFYKKVKGQTGFAPVDLIKEFRLSHAAELLQTTNLTITEVAWRSGFKDAGYFGKCFRKRYGMSPREFINQTTTTEEEN